MIDLSNLDLKTLDPSIGELTSLQDLYLHGNQLESIPDTIGNLNSLIGFNIQFNNIIYLPPTIKDLNSLQLINAINNPLDEKSKGYLRELSEKGVKVYFSINP